MGMGAKTPPAMQMPPPTDPAVDDRVAESEAKLEEERRAMIRTKSQGQMGTLLTSGQGVTEEAPTSRTILGG
tara:strand:+ start:656 stop:871 length:216 start_codon:yes stop_codon:yes gene_type:complete